jgi:(1->4)-alpha-D-glucan 1-alpha-D-glucosylmutase
MSLPAAPPPGSSRPPSRPPSPTSYPVPRATYRLQLHRDFGFRQATLALPYLAALGISHVYCSPYLRATPGSRHGYDGVDPGTINPDLGSPEDFNRFNRELRAHGLTQLLDIVPNHMGIESADNHWWQDVLRHGSASAFARHFDIDWSGAGGLAPGKLLLPILGASLEQVIAERQLTLRWDESEHLFRLAYFERSLPVNARGAALIYATAAAAASETLAGHLADTALVAAVAACQHYELAPWQDAATRINYRRFFDVSGLAALRMEDPAVFEAGHRQIIELVRAGIVGGLRVDHPDGLRDPATYFRRLQEAVATGEAPQQARGRLYIVAEKILAENEDLPADWPVNGTTGYDFANLACGTLLDGETAGEVDRVWRDFTGETAPSFGDIAWAAKKEVLARSFGSEMNSLAREFGALLPQFMRQTQDLPLIAEVLAETIACFPVYRTYPGPAATDAARRIIRQACREAGRRLDERRPQQGATAAASPGHHALLAALEEILTGPTGDGDPAGRAIAAPDRDRAEWAVRFQQLCAPVMAKGVEDTALYRWTRLVSVNDVGADPDVMGVPVDHFHRANARRCARWPHAMLATSTHDNKRGEYVRMRINLISEDPARWRDIAWAWRREADRLMDRAGLSHRPSSSDLYLLFQTFIGTWPVPDWHTPPAQAKPSTPMVVEPLREPLQDPMQDYAGRIKAYMTKACREAKLQTSWTAPDEAYEGAIHRLIDLTVADAALATGIGQEVLPFAWYGALNSLTLTTLKLTAPGVPDIYQGANVLDDSLVDPDNRRPVDFTQRLAMIQELAQLARQSAARIRTTLSGWLAAGDFARLKLWTIHRLLGWRALQPQLFEAGDYVPVPVVGPRSRHCIAYARIHEGHGILVVATRLYRQLGFPGPAGAGLADAGGGAAADAAGGAAGIWHGTALDLQAAGIRAARLSDILYHPADSAGPAGGRAGPAQAVGPASLAVAPLLQTLPIAVLHFDIDQAAP